MTPRLLVSVRDAAEALAALDGGADVIDVKEPARGALGAADMSQIAAVVQAVDGRAPVTVAMGELVDLMRAGPNAKPSIPSGVSLFKIGLAGCRDMHPWPAMWRAAINGIAHGDATPAARPVAVVYADWRDAAAPDPNDVLIKAAGLGCPALLVDTFDKSSGSLFDHWPVVQLGAFVEKVQSHGIAVVLAGSLAIETIAIAVSLRPDLVAVRTAACDAGRNGTVASQRVKTLRAAIEFAARAITTSPLVGIRCAVAPSSGVADRKFFASNG